MNTLGENLRAAREKSSMKQEYAAVKLGGDTAISFKLGK